MVPVMTVVNGHCPKGLIAAIFLSLLVDFEGLIFSFVFSPKFFQKRINQKRKR